MTRAGNALHEGVVTVEVGEGMFEKGDEGGEQGREGSIERGLEFGVEVIDVGGEFDRGAGAGMHGDEDRGGEKGGMRGDGIGVGGFGSRDGLQGM